MKPNIRVFKNPEMTARAFADFIEESINQQNTHIALSGGSTPNQLYQILGKDYSFRIKWLNAHLYWGDERCVPPFSEESNFKSVKSNLVDHIAIPSENIHRIRGENDPVKEIKRYSQRIKTLLPENQGIPEFDIMLLGLGTDGHTASIFPDQMHLLSSNNICEIARHPETGQSRITLTGTVINRAKHVVFLVTGRSKAEKVKQIINATKDSKTLPAAHIIPTSNNLYWYLDEEAASLINP
jgi:6-phosphogluconolactonase